MPDNRTAIERLTDKYLVKENESVILKSSYFEDVPTALSEWSAVVLAIGFNSITRSALSMLCQTIFLMGYHYGKLQRDMPQFIVAEEAP